MKVVIINEGLGYPPNRGNWLRTLNLLLPLAGRHEITYICRGAADEQATRRAREFYSDHGIRSIITSDHPAENRGPAFYGRLAANLLSPLPYSVTAHRSREVRGAIRQIAAQQQVDVWQFEAISYADTLRGTSARTLVVAHNVESLIWQRLHETEPRALRKWYIGEQRRKYEHFEGRVLREATCVVAVSREDAELMEDRFGVEHPYVVDNGVDVAYFSGIDRTRADPRDILFLGSLDWRPNLDSIEQLLDDILPSVLRHEPDARLSIVGRNPPAWLRRRAAALPNVELHADVPDVRPYLARAGVLAVPLRIGGGSRLKILEAMAAGVPVVSSRIGCEGLRFHAGRDLVVVETSSEMSAALVDAIRDPERMREMVRRGADIIDEYYDWRRLADRLEAVWVECAAAGSASSSKSAT